MGERPWRASAASVAMCARAATEVAVEKGHATLAFPVIGAGSGGMSAPQAEHVLLDTLEGIEAPVSAVVVRHRAG